MSEAPPEPTIQIHIKTMTQSTHHVRILPTATVSELKSLLFQSIPDSPVAQQRIIYRGRALADSQILSAAGVVEDATIHLVLRPADAPPLPIPGAPSAAPAQGMRFPMGNQVMGGPGGQMFNMVFDNLGGGGLGGFRFGGMDAAQQQAGAAGNETEEEAQFAAATMTEVSNALNGLFSSMMGGGTAAGTGSAVVPGPLFPAAPLPPHLITSLSSYINRLNDPNFSPPPFPLTSHSLVVNQMQAGTPAGGSNTGVDAVHVNLTTALQQLLSGPATPHSPALQELLTRSVADPTGRSRPTAALLRSSVSATTASTSTTTPSATASLPSASNRSTETAAPTPLPAALPAGQGLDLLSSMTNLGAALTEQQQQQQLQRHQQLNQQLQQQVQVNTPYAYTSLAVAALSQLLTRSLTYVESTPEVMRSTAQSLDEANESMAQQQLQLLSTSDTTTTSPPQASVHVSASPELAGAATAGGLTVEAAVATRSTSPTAASGAAAGPATTVPAAAATDAGVRSVGAPAAPRLQSDILAEELQHCASNLAARSALLLELARLSMATSLALTGAGHILHHWFHEDCVFQA